MYSKTVEELKQDIVFTAMLRGRSLVFHSTWGLFSPKQVDEGSLLLIEHVEVPKDALVLDIGCGYGPIGLALAASASSGQVHMVDKDITSLEYAKKNAELNGISNVEIYPSNALSQVPQMKFDLIVSNLPGKVGRELLHIIISDARDHLKVGGMISVVTISGIRTYIKKEFIQVFGNYEKIKQGGRYTLASAVRQ